MTFGLLSLPPREVTVETSSRNSGGRVGKLIAVFYNEGLAMKESRCSTRFPLEFPTLLRWQVGRLVHTVKASTKNISRSGLYIFMKRDQQPGSRVEFEVELPPTAAGGPGALLRGKGHLIRREDLGNQISGVAAAIERYEFITTSVASPGNFQALPKPPADAPQVRRKSAPVIAMQRR
jgi:hypothetical protein